MRAAGRYVQAAAMYARHAKVLAAGANVRDAAGALFGEQLTDSGRRPLHVSGATPPSWVARYEAR
jgi:hypothetical protein